MTPDNKSKKKGPLGDGPKMPKFNIYWIYGILFSVLLYATFFSKMAPDVNVISHNEFAKLMASGDVEKYVKVENKKVVQQWYFGEEETPSIVTLKLHEHKEGTSVELNHTNIPDEAYREITEGWDEIYFGNLEEYF